MAKITNAFTTKDAKANREDLSDIIANISPTETPLLSIIGSGKRATNVTYDWQTEALRAVDKNNARPEGDTTNRKPGTPTARQSNVCQILEDNATVSNSQNASDPAGKKKEMGHQIALVGAALKLDLDAIISGEQARSTADDGNAVVRKTRAMEHFIQTNVSLGATGANAANADVPLTDGTQRPFTEDLLLNTLQLAWDNGGKPGVLLMGGFNKRRFSTFTGRAATQVPVGQKTVTQTVEVYQSDFGTLKALPSRNSRSRTVLGIDSEKACVRWLRPWHKQELGAIGDAETTVVRGEGGLQVDNEKAHLKIADLTTA